MHLCSRIVRFHNQGLIDNAASYDQLKGSLNSESSFTDFLGQFLTEWVFEEATTNSSAESNDHATLEHQLAPEDVPVVPGKRRMQFFNTDEGKALRLASNLKHYVLSGVYPPKRCYICQMITTSKCSSCTVHLCRTSFGSNRRSCWTKHHENSRVSASFYRSLTSENVLLMISDRS